MKADARYTLPGGSRSSSWLRLRMGGTARPWRPGRSIAIALTTDSDHGSFDTKAIIWSLETGEAQQCCCSRSQVDAVAALPRGRYASAGRRPNRNLGGRTQRAGIRVAWP